MSIQFGEELARERSRPHRMDVLFEGGTALEAAETGERVARQSVADFELLGWSEAVGGALRTVRRFHSEAVVLRGMKSLRRQTRGEG